MVEQHQDLSEELKPRMGKVYLATEAAFKEMKADFACAWLKAAEEDAAPQQDGCGQECVTRHCGGKRYP